jgi:hypothetical protein
MPNLSDITKMASLAPSVDPVAVAQPDTQSTKGKIRGHVNYHVLAKGVGPISCPNANPRNVGAMSGWAPLSAVVRVTTDEGASADVSVTGNITVGGDCRSGRVFMSGSGKLYKDGRPVGTVSLSGESSINRLATDSGMIEQDVYLTGSYEESADAVKKT